MRVYVSQRRGMGPDRKRRAVGKAAAVAIQLEERRQERHSSKGEKSGRNGGGDYSDADSDDNCFQVSEEGGEAQEKALRTSDDEGESESSGKGEVRQKLPAKRKRGGARDVDTRTPKAAKSGSKGAQTTTPKAVLDQMAYFKELDQFELEEEDASEEE